MFCLRNAWVIVLAILLGGCESILNEDLRLASAEPLFGRDLDQCLDDPEFMIGLLAKKSITGPAIVKKRDRSGTPDVIDCNQLRDLFENYLYADPQTAVLNGARTAPEQRNELIQALVGMSNRKCGRYSAHIKTFDGQTNSWLSFLSIATGGVGGIVQGADAARILSGSSAIASGTRVAVNDAWFSNQTIQVLVAGYEKERSNQLRAIHHRQTCPINLYPTMQGIADALQYHSSCSLITGLSAAAQAIERSDQPGIDVVRRQLTEMAAIRRQAELVVSGLPEEAAPETVQANSILEQAEADYRAAKDKLSAKIAQLSTPIPGVDGAAATLPDAATVAAIKSEIVELTKETERTQKYRDAKAKELADAKTNESSADAEKRGKANLVSSQSETLVCPFDGQARTSGGQ